MKTTLFSVRILTLAVERNMSAEFLMIGYLDNHVIASSMFMSPGFLLGSGHK